MKVKIAVVGCGRNSYAVHFPSWRALSSKTEIIGVFDVNEKACQKAASTFKVKAFSSYTDVLESDAQIVDICTPTPTHYPLAKEALLKGKHTLTEKPLLTSQEGRELTDLAKSKNVRFGVVQHYIYSKALEKVRAIIATGLLGKPLHYEISYPTGMLDLTEWAAREEWGGFLWEFGAHPSYTIAALFGKPDRVFGAGRLATTEQFSNFTIFLEKGHDSASIRLCPDCSQSYLLDVNGPLARLRADLLTDTVMVDRNWFSKTRNYNKLAANVRLNTIAFWTRSAFSLGGKGLRYALIGPKSFNQYRLIKAFVEYVNDESKPFFANGETATTAMEILESARKGALT